MKTNELMNNAKRTLSRAGLKLKKYSPEILIAAGVVGTVASAVMACKATTKLSEIMEESKDSVEQIHYATEHPEELSEEYTKEDGQKDLVIVYTQTAVKVIKLYGPSVVLGALSITAVLTSNNILRKRNVALAAAYATVDKNFKDYRNRVVERFGKELDHELRYNIKAQEIEEKTENKDGTETVEKKNVNVAAIDGYSDYAKFFDEYCAGWSKDPEKNLFFLKRQQDYANNALQAKGYLFLNDVYDMLGIQRTKAGQCVGWIYDEKNPIGDNYVDFGIYDVYKEGCHDFVNGRERSILLDFNVDGNILDLI